MWRSRTLGVLGSLTVIIVFVSLIPPALAQEPVFTETFDDPTLPSWEHSPEATAADGVLRIEPGGFAEHQAFWADLMLTVSVRCTDDAELQVRYRWSEDANYTVSISRPFVTLERIELGSVTHLGQGFAALPLGEWVDVTVTVDGDFHHMMVGDSPVLIAEDPYPLPEGGIGLLVVGEAVGEFDSVEVSAAGQVAPPAEPSPASEPTQLPTPEPTTMPSEAQPTPSPEPPPTPAGRGGICPGAAALPLALLGLVWVSRRRW
jgi:uncharacterized protein (TIGR03382 family)